MKFKISVVNVKKAVALIRDVVPPRSVSQEGSGILLEIGGGRATFSAVGSDTIIKTSVPVSDVEEDGRLVVNSSMFASVINSFANHDGAFGTEDLSVSTNQKTKTLTMTSKTTYKTGKSVSHKRVVPLLNSELFPMVPNYDDSKAFEFPASVLGEAISKVHYAASSASDAGVLGGLYMSVSDGTFVCAATDGVKLAEFSYKVGAQFGTNFESVVPAKFAVKAAKCLDAEASTVRLLSTGNIFWVNSGDVLVGGVVLMGAYPKYTALLKPVEREAVVDKKVFFDNIRNLDFGEVDEDRVRLRLKDGSLHISTPYADNESIEVKFDGEFAVDFNIKLLRLSVQSMWGDELKIGFSGPTNPVFFCSDPIAPEVNFRAVLMPMKSNAEN